MANKRTAADPRKKGNVPVNPVVVLPPPVLHNIIGTYWPEQFASPRTALFMIAACVVLAALVFSTAALGGFTSVKVSLAERLELTSPEMVSGANFDLAAVIWALGAMAFLGVIHPCFGIALLLLFRPWLDGYTFFTDNTYFTWAIYLLSALWLLQLIKRRERILAPPPVFILGALMVVMLVMVRYSCQFYNTYQHVWLWMGYTALFMLAVNTLRSRPAWGIAVGVFMLAMGLQAAFSILHFEFLLPHLRKIIQDPAVLQRYFNTTTITPELARRFNVNRAFGSMLFPNALAAYLLLGIPLTLAAIVPWWQSAYGALKRPRPDAAENMQITDRILILVIGVIVGIGCFVAVLAASHFPREYRDTVGALPIYLQTAPLTVLALILACCVSLGVILVLARYGIDGFFYLFRFSGMLVLAPVLLYTLWITYSRGAYLGLLFSGVWSVMLWSTSPAQAQALRAYVSNRRKIVPVLLLLFCLGLMSILVAEVNGSSSYAQQTGPANAAGSPPDQTRSTPDTRSQVRQEGLTLTTSDLVDPASLRLRFGYWRVTWRMAWDNLLTGVGQGNFAIAYPEYQYVGAGDVREAHNGFLQMFAETGFFGGMLFMAFWVYFGLWGAWRIVNEINRHEKLLLLGVYTGVVAFCMHAFLDINFSHPSLVMFVMCYSGLFYARALTSNGAGATGETPAESPQSTVGTVTMHRVAAVMLLVFLVVCVGATFRVYAQQLVIGRFSFLNVGNDAELNRRMRIGQFFISETGQMSQLIARGERPENLPRIQIAQALLFLDTIEEVAENCVFYKPSPEQRNRFVRIEPDEPIPHDGMLVVANRPLVFRSHAAGNIDKWVEELKRIDSWFPHNHTLALHIKQWYELLANNLRGTLFSEKRPGWIRDYLEWSQVLAQRNPRHADARLFYAQALLWNIINNPDADGEVFAALALREWQETIDLTPISPGHRHACASGYSQLAEYCRQKGDNERADLLKQEAETRRVEAQKIQEKRAAAHLYP